MPSYPSQPVLIVDDETPSRLGISLALRSSGIDNVIECANPREALACVKDKKPCLALLDLIMPGCSGAEILKAISRDFPETAVIIVSGQSEVSLAVSCMKLGAFDYLTKPFDKGALVKAVRRAVEMSELRGENTLIMQQLLEAAPQRDPAFKDIVTANPQMEALFKYCVAVAPGRQPVMVSGETGVGKELVSRAIHKLSGRSGRFVAVNLAGLDSNVFSDTLFGHLKGAFTGADAKRKGLVEEAEGGTLLLDEIGELSEEAQVKLLRLLQEREYSPLGSDAVKTSDARIIVASNRDLAAEVESGKFRRDLFFRLKTHHVRIPPLRERPEDVAPLLAFFLAEAAKEFGKEPPEPTPSLLAALKRHPFKGNVRELRAMAYDAVGSCHGSKVSATNFGFEEGPQAEPSPSAPEAAAMSHGSIAFPAKLPTLKEAANLLAEEALRRAGGSQSAAAKLIGVSQQALSKRLKKKGAAEKRGAE